MTKKVFWWLKLIFLKEYHFHKEKLNDLISSDQWTTPGTSQSFQSLKGSGDKNWVENLTMEIWDRIINFFTNYFTLKVLYIFLPLKDVA